MAPSALLSPPASATVAADAGIRTFAILCYATPVFFLGLVKLIFAVWLNISSLRQLDSEMQFTLVSPTDWP